MKKSLPILILFFSSMYVNSLQAQSFEYRCLKGGMSKSEFHEACNTKPILKINGNFKQFYIEDNINNEFDYSGSPFAGKDNSIKLFWTEDDLLWRIEIQYYKSQDILIAGAQVDAISEKFPDVEMKITQRRNKNSIQEIMHIILFDEKVASAAQEKLKKEILPSI